MQAENEISHILVVDDEQHQLDTVCRGLFLYGYQCTGVTNVQDALDQLQSNEKRFNLVLTDLTMPESSGLFLIETIQKLWPGLAIIVITGLAASPEIGVVKDKQIPILQKPFHPDALDRIIKDTLGLA